MVSDEEIKEGTSWFIWGTVALFAIGGVILGWTLLFGPLFSDAERERFEHGKSHQGAVVQDFADRCNELAHSENDPVGRKALIALIAQRAADEDIDNLQMNATVRKCVNDAVKEYSGG